MIAFLEGRDGRGGRFPLLTAANGWLKSLGVERKVKRVWELVFSPHKDRVVATVSDAGQSAGAGRGFRGGASTQAMGIQRGAGQGGAVEPGLGA